MAVRTRIDDSSSMIGEATPLVLVEGKITENQALILSNQIKDITDKINGGIDHGIGVDGHRGNVDEQHVDVICPPVANTEFAVPHGLGRLPNAYTVVRKDRAVDIYDSSSGSWNDTIIYLKATVASAQVRLRID